MADGSLTQIDDVVTNRSVTQATVADPHGHPSLHRFNNGRGLDVVAVDALGQQARITRGLTTNQVMEVRDRLDRLDRLTKCTYITTGNVNSVLDPQQNPTIFEYGRKEKGSGVFV